MNSSGVTPGSFAQGIIAVAAIDRGVEGGAGKAVIAVESVDDVVAPLWRSFPNVPT